MDQAEDLSKWASDCLQLHDTQASSGRAEMSGYHLRVVALGKKKNRKDVSKRQERAAFLERKHNMR